jgi:KipI family sensor histidine kinase inhibitor
MRHYGPVVDIHPVGAGALLLECGDDGEVEAWRAELVRRRDRGELPAVDIVPGARTVLIDGLTDAGAVARRIPGWAPSPAARTAAGPLVEIPTVYDGADLPDVARLWGVRREEAVTRLSTIELRVAFCGFAPGFAYLTGLPEQWAVPRLPTPRTRVPAGSVALAGPYAGVYPTDSPGGWRLVGRTEAELFDRHRDPPVLLAPGTRVRFPDAS